MTNLTLPILGIDVLACIKNNKKSLQALSTVILPMNSFQEDSLWIFSQNPIKVARRSQIIYHTNGKLNGYHLNSNFWQKIPPMAVYGFL